MGRCCVDAARVVNTKRNVIKHQDFIVINLRAHRIVECDNPVTLDDLFRPPFFVDSDAFQFVGPGKMVIRPREDWEAW